VLVSYGFFLYYLFDRSMIYPLFWFRDFLGLLSRLISFLAGGFPFFLKNGPPPFFSSQFFLPSLEPLDYPSFLAFGFDKGYNFLANFPQDASPRKEVPFLPSTTPDDPRARWFLVGFSFECFHEGRAVLFTLYGLFS